MAKHKPSKIQSISIAPRRRKKWDEFFRHPTRLVAILAFVGGVLALIFASQGLRGQVDPTHILDAILQHRFAPNAVFDQLMADGSDRSWPDTQLNVDIDRLFLFNEGNSVYFKDNIAGLRSSLMHVFTQGCIDSNNITYPPSPLHVVFDARTPPLTSDFIQIQLEQTRSSYFTKIYLKKLSRAAQVWEFSTKNVEIMQKYLPRVPQYVPSSAYLNVLRPVFRCNDINGRAYSTIPKDVSFTVYERGFYLLCQIKADNMMHVVSHRRSISGSSSGPRPSARSLQPRPFLPPDVLFYGQIEGSYHNSREKTCDMLVSAGINVLCLQNVFGELLEYFVCKSKVVLSNQFYQDASLGTHRIDPLLLAGKIVVATPSADSALDLEYASAVVFSNRKQLVQTLRKILKEWNKYSRAGAWLNQFMQRRWENVEPLCKALGALPVFADSITT